MPPLDVREEDSGRGRKSKSGQAGDVLLPNDMRGLKMIHKDRKHAVRRNYMFRDFVPSEKKDIGL